MAKKCFSKISKNHLPDLSTVSQGVVYKYWDELWENLEELGCGWCDVEKLEGQHGDKCKEKSTLQSRSSTEDRRNDLKSLVSMKSVLIRKWNSSVQ